MLSQQHKQAEAQRDMNYTDYLLWKFIVLVAIVFVWKFFEGMLSGRANLRELREVEAERKSDSQGIVPGRIDRS